MMSRFTLQMNICLHEEIKDEMLQFHTRSVHSSLQQELQLNVLMSKRKVQKEQKRMEYLLFASPKDEGCTTC